MVTQAVSKLKTLQERKRNLRARLRAPNAMPRNFVANRQFISNYPNLQGLMNNLVQKRAMEAREKAKRNPTSLRGRVNTQKAKSEANRVASLIVSTVDNLTNNGGRALVPVKNTGPRFQLNPLIPGIRRLLNGGRVPRGVNNGGRALVPVAPATGNAMNRAIENGSFVPIGESNGRRGFTFRRNGQFGPGMYRNNTPPPAPPPAPRAPKGNRPPMNFQIPNNHWLVLELNKARATKRNVNRMFKRKSMSGPYRHPDRYGSTLPALTPEEENMAKRLSQVLANARQKANANINKRNARSTTGSSVSSNNNSRSVSSNNNGPPPPPPPPPPRPQSRSFTNRARNAARAARNTLSGLFGRRPAPPPPTNWSKVAANEKRRAAITRGNFVPGKLGNKRNGYNFRNGNYGPGLYRKMSSTAPGNGNKKNAGNGNKKNAGNGNKKNAGNGNKKNAGGGGGAPPFMMPSITIKTGNVQATGGAGGEGRGGAGGEGRGGEGRGGEGRGGESRINSQPSFKVNVPEAAMQSSVGSLPSSERLALTNAGGYRQAAGTILNAGGPATVERAIQALNNAGGNASVAAQRSGLPPSVFQNVKRLGGPVTARRALTAVSKVTKNTAPYVGPNATRRVAPNLYTLAPPKKRRTKKYRINVAELNRVVNAVKKKKLISLVAHNVTKTNIHLNENRLKPYYKRVIKAAVLKKPFAKIAKGHAKKLVLSRPVKKKTTRRPRPINNYTNEARFA
jgi:hypothetical protein